MRILPWLCRFAWFLCRNPQRAFLTVLNIYTHREFHHDNYKEFINTLTNIVYQFFVSLTILYIYYLGSLQISHSCCLIIHVHFIHCICYKWIRMTSSLGHHHMPCHHICHGITSTIPCHAIISHIIIHAMSSIRLSFTEFVLLWYPWLFICHYWNPLT